MKNIISLSFIMSSFCSYVQGQITPTEFTSTIAIEQPITASEVQLQLSANVFLEGAYNMDGTMHTKLLESNLLDTFKYNPLVPFVYFGNSRLYKMSNGFSVPSNAVDVIKFQLRIVQPPYTVVDSAYAWLLKDGQIRDYITGTKNAITFYQAPEGNYYVEVRHRNHLPIVSRNAYYFKNLITTNINFTNPKLLMGDINSYKILKPVVAVMVAGDVAKTNNIRETNAKDVFFMLKSINDIASTKKIYHVADGNMDGFVDIKDKQLVEMNDSKLYFFPLEGE